MAVLPAAAPYMSRDIEATPVSSLLEHANGWGDRFAPLPAIRDYGFSPRYRVANIQMITQRGVFGFVYGISESVTPWSGEILHNVPIYVVTSAVVIDRNQREVLVADLN